jgi:copper chaperone CopZ
MKPLFLIASSVCLSWAIEASDAAKPELAQRTFYISGLECGGCVYMAQQAMTETAGVSEVEVVQMLDSYAKVAYDPKKLTEHQIAQAVRDAIPLHGMPYLASLKLRIPAYAEENNAAQVQALFAGWKKWLKIAVTDPKKGELEIHFEPLTKEEGIKEPQGWSLALLEQALRAPSPKGLGLAYQVVKHDDP